MQIYSRYSGIPIIVTFFVKYSGILTFKTIEMVYFGDNLRYLRKERKLRQDELAKELGTTRSTLSNYEQAISGVSLEFVVKTSNFFGISIDDLILKKLEEEEDFDISKVSKSKGKKLNKDTDLSDIIKRLEAVEQEVFKKKN